MSTCVVEIGESISCVSSDVLLPRNRMVVDDGGGLGVVDRHLNQSPSGESLIELSKAYKIITHVMDPWTLS